MSLPKQESGSQRAIENKSATTTSTVSRRDVSNVFDNPYKPLQDVEDDYTSVEKFDVVLIPVNNRKMTLYPLPFLLTGVISMSISVHTHPWLEYTVLAEGMTTGSIFRQHVKTGLFEQCLSTEDDNWECESFIFHKDHMMGIQAFLFINCLLGWVALILCFVQSGKTWIEETDDEVSMNVPGVMLIELISAIFCFASVLQTFLILAIFQYIDGGSASNGFFLCEMGVILLAGGGVLAMKVAIKPVRDPIPWRVQMVGDEDSEVMEGEEVDF